MNTENTLLWNTHLINQSITTLSKACYVKITINSFTSTDTVITVYHTYFYTFMSHGLIFWGYSINIFIFKRRSQELSPVSEKEIHAEIVPNN